MRIDRCIVVSCETLPFEGVTSLLKGFAEGLGVAPICQVSDDVKLDGLVLLQVGPFIFNMEEVTAMAAELRDRQKEKA
ncbi:hypothetical protein [Neorhizobium sp. DAR64860/K0K1]|uniref:hypothetical protein n=1 Tax=Neorhizobium sp. DAR64860/K0K1 TaxID=3421955 RepID=UPI003D2CD0A0